jgi:hypothetical protein
MMWGGDEGLKGCAARTGKPASAPDPLIATPRLADMPFHRKRVRRQGCHLYFARQVTFLSCADKPRPHNADFGQVGKRTPLRRSLIAGTPSSAKVSGLDCLVTIRLAAIHCLGGSFLPVDGMPSQVLGRRSRSRPTAAKRAANGGGLEGDRRPRNNAMAIGRPQNAGQYPSRQFPISTAQDIFGSPAE